MIGILIKRRIWGLESDMHPERTPGAYEGRDWNSAFARQGVPKISSQLSEPRRETWNRLSLTAFRRNQPCEHLDRHFQPLELWDNKFLWLKPLLSYVVTTALENQYSSTNVFVSKILDLYIQISFAWSCFSRTAQPHPVISVNLALNCYIFFLHRPDVSRFLMLRFDNTVIPINRENLS